MRISKKILSVLLAVVMIVGTMSVGFGGFGEMVSELLATKAAAANTATLNITANTSGTTFDSKGNYLNLWQAGAMGSASEASLDFIEYVEIMNATGGGDGQVHQYARDTSRSGSCTNRDLIDSSGNFITSMMTALTDSIDSIIAIGAKPLIKLGGVPFYFTMTSNPNKYIEEGMTCNPYPPDSDISYTTKYLSTTKTGTGYLGYQYYLMDVIQYLINTYGIDEVRTWRWGVMTEFENRDWFYAYDDTNGSSSYEDSYEAFWNMYDYSAEAVIQMIGEDYTYIGAHAMAVSEGIWDENKFIDHIADGFNYAEGDTKLGVNGEAVSTLSKNRHGVHCDYIAVSYYEPTLGSASYNTKTLTQTVDYIRDYAEECADDLEDGNTREKTSAATLNNLKYGVDEGRILSGTSGANSTALNSRTVGYTIQGAYDARMYYQMVEDDIDYLSSWSFTSNGAGYGYPAITYHVADKTAEMAGSTSYKATVTGGSGITTKPGSSNVEYNAYGSYNTSDSTMRVMAYNFCNNYSYTTETNLTLNVTLPSSFAGKNVKVKKYAIDDTANFFDEWKTDCTANGITASSFSWSGDDPEIESANTSLSTALSLASSRRDYYKTCATLTPTAEILTVDSDGGVTITDTGMQANSAVYYEIVETDLSDTTSTVYFNVNDDSGANVNLLALMDKGVTTVSNNGITYSYDPATGVISFNGTAVRNTTSSEDNIVIADIPVTKANGAVLAEDTTVTFSSEGVAGSISGGGLVAELYTEGGESVATAAGLTGDVHSESRCYIDMYNTDNQSKTRTIPTGATAAYVRLFVYIPDGGTQATFNDFQVKLKLEEGSTATKYTPNARVINMGDLYGTMPVVERSNYKLNSWQNSGTNVDASSTYNGASNTTLIASWNSTPSCVVYSDVNHDSIGVNLFQPTLDATTYTPKSGNGTGSIAYSYNQNTGVITLDGSIKGLSATSEDDNNHYFISIPITTTVGTQYAATIDFLSGNITYAGETNSPTIVVDLSSVDPITNGNLSSTRSYLNAPSVGTYTSTLNGKGDGVWKSLVAQSYIVFWVWCDGTQFSLNDVKLKVKVAQESTASAYSPNAKACTQGATYGIMQEPEYYEGHKFLGWYTDTSYATAVTSASTVPASSSATIYAKWQEESTYTVTFDKQGGSGGDASATVTAEVAPPDLSSVPTKSGYRFGGYYTKTNGQGTCYYNENGEGTAAYAEGASVTLYANWISSSNVNATTNSNGNAYFNVPETIYLKTNALTFEYVNDQELKSDGTYTANQVVGGKTISSGGKVQFYAPDVSSVDFAWYMGNASCTATVGGTAGSSGKVTVSSKNSNGVFETTITAGSVNALTSDTDMITWVVSYIKDGKPYSFINYTTIYAPLAGTSSTLCTMMSSRVKGLGSHYACISRYSTWCIGLNAIETTTHSAAVGNATSAPNNSMKEPPTTNTTFTNKTCSRNDSGSADNDLIFETGTGYKGYSGFHKNFSDSKGTYSTSYVGYWEGVVYGDTFRYSNLNQIPNLRIGLDLHEFWTTGSDSSARTSLGYYAEGGTDTRTNAIAEYCPGEVENSGVRLGLSTAYRMNIDVSSVESEKDTVIHGYGYHKGEYAVYESSDTYSYVRYIIRDKSELRTKVQEVYTKMGCFSDLTAACQKNLLEKLRSACYCIGNPSATPEDISSATTDLNAIYYEKKTGTATFNDYKMIGNTTKTLVNTKTITYNFGETVTSEAGTYEGYTLSTLTTTNNLFDASEFVAITQANEGTCVSSNTTYGTNGLKVVTTTGTDNYTTMPYWNAYGCELTRNQYRVPVTPGHTYRLSATMSGTGTENMFIFPLFAYGDATLNECGSTTGAYVDYTIPENCYYVSFRFGNKTAGGVTSYFNNISFVDITASATSATTITRASGETITFDRVYTPTLYNVTYNLNGGSGTVPAAQSKYHDCSVQLHYLAAENCPTRAGYTFEGWNTKADGTGVDYALGSTYSANADATLYAKWVQYTVTVKPNGGTYNGSTDDNVTAYTAGTTASFGEPTRAGYTFAGWNIENMPTDAYILGNGYSNDMTNISGRTGLIFENSIKSDSEGVYTNYKIYGTNTDSVAYPQLDLRRDYAIAAGDTVTVTLEARKNSGSSTVNIYNGSAANAWSDNGNNEVKLNDWIKFTITKTFDTASSTGQVQLASSIEANATATAAAPFYDVDIKNVKIVITHSGGTTETVPSVMTMPTSDVTLTANWVKNENIIYYDNEFQFDTMFSTENQFATTNYKENTFTVAPDNEVDIWSESITLESGHTYQVSLKATNMSTTTAKAGYWVCGGGDTNKAYVNKWGGSDDMAENGYKDFKDTFTVDSTYGTSVKIRFDTYYKNSKVKYSDIQIIDITDSKSVTGTTYKSACETEAIGDCPATFTKTGYTFEGWYTGKNGTGTKYTSTSAMTGEDLYLYSNWTANTLRVGYDNLYFSNGFDAGTYNSTEKSITVSHTNGATVTSTETSAYTSNFIPVEGDKQYIVSADFTLTNANSQIYCFFYKDTSTACSVDHTDAAQQVVNCDGKDGTYGTPSFTTSGNHYYVVTTPSDCKYIKLRVDCDNDTANTAGTVTVKNIHVINKTTERLGATYSKPEETFSVKTGTLITPSHTGYTFEGWYKEAALTNKVTANTTIDSSTTQTLYSNWTINSSTLSVNPNSGLWNGSTSTQSFTQNYNTTKSIPVPTRTGYTFGGWTFTKASENDSKMSSTTAAATYTFGSKNGVTDTLTAIWNINSYGVTFDVQGHGTAPATQSINYGGKVTQPTAPTATGYTFGGWYKESSCTNAWNFSTDTITKTTTIYAKWTKVNYTITYNTDGGSTISNGSYTIESTSIAFPTAPTKAGYVFSGWKLTTAPTSGTGLALNTTYKTNPTISSCYGNIIFTAQWTPVANNAAFVVDTGLPVTLDLSSKVYSGAAITAVASGTGYEVSFSGTTITFTPTAINGIVSFNYTAKVGDVTGTATIKIIPASTVYYEESFVSFTNDTSSTPISWQNTNSSYNYDNTAASAAIAALKAWDSTTTSSYGANSAYSSSNSATYSLGNAKKVTIPKANTNKNENCYAQFTFTGTGFDINTVVSMATGYVKIVLYQGTQTTTKYKSYAASIGNGYQYGALYLKDDKLSFDTTGTPLYVNGTGTSHKLSGKTYYEQQGSGTVAYGWLTCDDASSVAAVYQSPALSKTDLAYGTYTVRVIPKFSSVQDLDDDGSTDFYFDSVRIYNPLGTSISDTDAQNAYTTHKEYDASYERVRDLIVDADGFASAVSLGDGKTAGIAFLGTSYNVLGGYESALDFFDKTGPKTEIYLDKDNTIAFKVTTNSSTLPAKLALGMKLAYAYSSTTGAGSLSVTSYNGSGTAKTATYSVSTPTEQYINLADAVQWVSEDGQYVATIVVTNNSTNAVPISLTNIKYSYSEPKAASTQSINEDLQMISAVDEEESRELIFYFDDDLFDTLNQSKDDILVDYENVSMNWDNSEIELGESATLTVNCPEIINKITVNGEEITTYEELESGKAFSYSVTPDAVGEYKYNVVLFDENGYNSDIKASPVCKVKEPKIDLSDIIVEWDADAIKLGESATVTFNTNSKIKAVIIGDETITEFAEGEEGRRIFSYTVTPDAIGKYIYSAVVKETFGYTSSSFNTPVLSVNSYVVSTDNIVIEWAEATVEIGENAVLTVKTPDNIAKVTADGVEFDECVDNGDGTKTFTLTVATDKVDNIEFAIRLTDENGMISKTVSSGVVSVVEPAPVEPAPEKLTWWQKIIKFLKTLFSNIVKFFKEVF